MLTLKFIQENSELVVERLKIKNFDASEIVSEVITFDNQRKELQREANDKQAEMNSLSKEISSLYKQGKRDEADAAKVQTANLKDVIKTLTTKQAEISELLNEALVQLPNVPHSSVPAGKSEDDNEVVKEHGVIPDSEGLLPHWELIEKYNLVDFELGTKLTGAGFPVYKGKGAKLQRALISYFLDKAERAGYEEVMPPILVNEDSCFGTGQLPDKEGQMYHATADNLYLVPTAEVPVTNIYRDVVLSDKDFPVKNTAYTPCFRREAGSWGSHVRGLNRLHQFDKVEIVRLAHPDDSYAALDEMVAYVEELVQSLGLPYRILRLCGGDLSFTSALTFDFEVYSAGQGRWLEVSSVSNFESFQANRLKLRFKETDKKQTQLAHTLNGSALALPRIVAALLENNQTPEGIKVPDVLKKYLNCDYIK